MAVTRDDDHHSRRLLQASYALIVYAYELVHLSRQLIKHQQQTYETTQRSLNLSLFVEG